MTENGRQTALGASARDDEAMEDEAEEIREALAVAASVLACDSASSAAAHAFSARALAALANSSASFAFSSSPSYRSLGGLANVALSSFH